MTTKSTALATAMKGGSISDRQAKSALNDAIDRITSLTRRASRSKEALMATGQHAVHAAETQGSLFLSSMAEGYFGTDTLKRLGGIDLRAPVGFVATGFGLYSTMNGEKMGGHALAIGNGVLGSWLASVGREAGARVAQRPSAEVARLVPGAPGQPDRSALRGLPTREVLLTPEGHEVRLTPEPAVRSDGRFVRARTTAEQAFEDGHYDDVLDAD